MAAYVETAWFSRETSKYLEEVRLDRYVRTVRSFGFPGAAVTALINKGFGFDPPPGDLPDQMKGENLLLVIDNKKAVRDVFSLEDPTDHAGVQAPDGATYVLGTESLDLGLFDSVVRGVASRVGLAAGLEPAHAACFVLDDVGILIQGSHGQGKSTLMAKLQESVDPGRLQIIDDDWVLFPLGRERIFAGPLRRSDELEPRFAAGGTPIHCVVTLQPRSRNPLQTMTRRDTAREIARGSYHMPNADLSEDSRAAAIERCLMNTHCLAADLWDFGTIEIHGTFGNVLDMCAPR